MNAYIHNIMTSVGILLPRQLMQCTYMLTITSTYCITYHLVGKVKAKFNPPPATCTLLPRQLMQCTYILTITSTYCITYHLVGKVKAKFNPPPATCTLLPLKTTHLSEKITSLIHTIHHKIFCFLASNIH
jgi:hypothetical protein